MKKYTDRGKKDTRSGFGEGLHLAGKADPRVVALAADLKGSLKMDAFAAEFPDRYYECGIAEANMIGVASGMAITGLVPFAGSFAEFVTGRVYDQVRMEVCYGKTNVKIASSHAGITLGEDGATISKRATSTVKKPTGKIQAMRIPAPSATAITAMQQFPPLRHMAQPPFPLHPMKKSAPG